GFAQLLQKRYAGKLDAQADEYFNYMVTSSKQMQALIDGLLEISRVGRDNPFEHVDAEQLLAEVEQQLLSVVVERHAQITHDPLPRLRASPLEFKQMLANLIGNGLKFQPGEAPRVHVSAQRRDGEWQFSVRDYGIGISAEHQEKVFQIFQRLHTAEQYEGTGIGLAICQKIARRHGGRIWVESSLGEGSTFHFTIRDA
ncbi:MAG TPA: ATP-binding protein, partial [Nevskiaceae bacterium]|nr:ATP-binding protein [Nevskiaceae bacterium]